MQFIPFSSQTRMSGVDQGDSISGRCGRCRVCIYPECGNGVSEQLKQEVDKIARAGGTPLVVTKNGKPSVSFT
jgi:K+-transporting ATPase ATPase B chain